MSRSRRKNWNVVNAPSLARWIVITGLLAVTGLIYVYLKIQLYHLGDQKKALEKSLADLRMQNQTAKGEIATLTSPPALQHRLKEGYLKMILIAERDIVRLNFSRTGDDAVQPVSNQRGGGR
jgi:cell division protein FtsB